MTRLHVIPDERKRTRSQRLADRNAAAVMFALLLGIVSGWALHGCLT